jgi:hypothetical protein
VTKVLNAEVSGADAARFAVSNLIGAMRVRSGSGPTAKVVATVHAESQALADTLRFERKTTRRGLPLVELRFPVDEERRFRHPAIQGRHSFSPSDDDDWGWFGRHRVSVSPDEGVLLYADVEIELPKGEREAEFYNRVGTITASDVKGRLRFDTAGGDVKLDKVGGDVLVDTGSGNLKGAGLEGSLRCDTGSGDCDIDGFSGDRISLDTGSGNVSLRRVSAKRIDADTGSGDVVAEGLETESFAADTGSGDVRLKLPRDMGFELRADTGGGDIENHIEDATPVVRRREVVGYRRGDGRVRFDLDTGSGDVVLETQD